MYYIYIFLIYIFIITILIFCQKIKLNIIYSILIIKLITNFCFILLKNIILLGIVNIYQ